MAFGQTSGPPASHRQIETLEGLLELADFGSFREARHRLGLTQRQANGKFTSAEASELIERLTDEFGDGSDGSDPSDGSDGAGGSDGPAPLVWTGRLAPVRLGRGARCGEVIGRCGSRRATAGPGTRRTARRHARRRHRRRAHPTRLAVHATRRFGGAVRLIALRGDAGIASGVAVEVDGRVLTAEQLGVDVASLADLYTDGLNGDLTRRLGDAALAAGDRFASEGSLVAERDVAPPISRSNNVIAVGQNYRAHAAEQHVAPPEVPLLFAKLSSSLGASGDDIVWDPSVATLVDYEAELGVVIGKVAHRVGVADAMDAVFGYCNVNDVTARDLQRSEGQWLRGKSHDTFCPVGPVVVTADHIPDPHALQITCTVNGELRQSATTGDMIFSIPELIAHISQAVALRPGDLICTGTPAGVGMHRTPPQLLADGDEVVVEVAGLGRLVNRCRTTA